MSLVTLHFLLLSKLTSAKLGPIDDHEYVRFIRSLKGSIWNIVPNLFSETEIGNWSESKRFRPLYYLLRITSAFLIDDNASLRYALRILLTIVLCLLLTTLLIRLARPMTQRWSSLLLGSISYIFFAGMFSLTDVTTRLGPSELGLAIAVVAGILIFEAALRYETTEARANRLMILLLLALATAIGFKENGLSLVVPLTYLFYRFRTQGITLHRSTLALSGVVLAYALWIYLGLVLSIGGDGTNVYGSSVGDKDAVAAILAVFRQRHFVVSSLALLVLLVDSKDRHDPKVPVMGIVLFSFLVIEGAFYRGDVLSIPRYFLLSEAISLLLTFWAASVIIERILNNPSLSRSTIASLTCAAILSWTFASQVSLPASNLTETWTRVEQVVSNTRNWADSIRSKVSQIETDGSVQVVIHLESDRLYEVAYSTIQYLKIDVLSETKFFLKYAGGTGEQTGLPGSLSYISLAGDSSWGVLPVSDFDPTQTTSCLFESMSMQSLPEYCESWLPL